MASLEATGSSSQSIQPTLAEDDLGSFTEAEPVEEELTEQQLRELYDNEEIDRFLHLFSAYVTEVRLPDTPSSKSAVSALSTVPREELEAPDEVNGSDTEWVPVNGPVQGHVPSATKLPPNQSLSEAIAHGYIVPLLPPEPMTAPQFTLGRLRLTTQRLYLAVEPAYGPFLTNLAELATWKNRKQSFLYCALFWLLWSQDLLLPALLLRTFFALLHRRIFSYPTVEQLRARRLEVTRAAEFGEEIQARLSASSKFGVWEMWRLFRVFNKPKKDKLKQKAKEKAKEKGFGKEEDGAGNEEGSGNKGTDEAEGMESATVLDDTKDSKGEKDIKRRILSAVSEIADLHERVKNIFIWRRPASSRIYGMAIFVIFLVTLILPAKYLAKLTYAVGGIFFWHITPIIVSLSPSDRARLPSAFGDAPTDADYAMDLISQRVAAGLDVKPSSSPKKNKKEKKKSLGLNSLNQNAETLGSSAENKNGREKSVDWKKWGERAAIGKSWADDGTRLMTGGQWPPRKPLVSQPSLAVGQPEVEVETYTFPAQHSSAPGLVTITPTTFFFTPLMAHHAKVVISFGELLGVKKTGLLKGLSLRWCPGGKGNGEEKEKEEKFVWVGGRDELFARIIGSGSDGKRWIKA